MQARCKLRSLKIDVGNLLSINAELHDVVSDENEKVEVSQESATFILSIKFCVQKS